MSTGTSLIVRPTYFLGLDLRPVRSAQEGQTQASAAPTDASNSADASNKGFWRNVLILTFFGLVSGVAGFFIMDNFDSIRVQVAQKVVVEPAEKATAATTVPETSITRVPLGELEKPVSPASTSVVATEEDICKGVYRHGELLKFDLTRKFVQKHTDGTTVVDNSYENLNRKTLCALRMALTRAIGRAQAYERKVDERLAFSYGRDGKTPSRVLFKTVPKGEPIWVKEVSAKWCLEQGLRDANMIMYGTTSCVLWHRMFLREHIDNFPSYRRYMTLLNYQELREKFQPKIRAKDFDLLSIPYVVDSSS